MDFWPFWPPAWKLFFGIVAFLAASVAVRGWRDLSILVLLTALLIFPIKWIGPALGLALFAENAIYYGPDADKGWIFNVKGTPALVAAIILGSFAMIAWKSYVANKAEAGAPPDASP